MKYSFKSIKKGNCKVTYYNRISSKMIQNTFMKIIFERKDVCDMLEFSSRKTSPNVNLILKL